MVRNEQATMSNRRALLTDREREIIAGDADVSNSYRYQTISRVRNRFDRLEEDLEVFREHGDLLEDLREIVCRPAEEDDIAESDLSNEPVQPVTDDGTTDQEEKEEIYQELQDQREIEDRVWDVIEDVTENWMDDEARLATRRRAAAEVLQHAVDTGEGVGKSSDIVDEVREKYPVEGQNQETYWRKNLRDVLSEVGTYSSGTHKYTVDGLDASENDE